MKNEWANFHNYDLSKPTELVLYLIHQKAYQYAASYCEDKRILEVGCGAGYGTRMISKQATEVIGVDKDEKAINFARENYDKPNIKYVKADPLDGLPFEDNNFDLVLSFQVIEHISPSKVRIFFQEIKRVLESKSGMLLLTTPNRKIRLLPFQKPWNEYHKKEYTAKGLRKLLRQYFPKVELFSLGGNEKLEKIARDRVRSRKNPIKVYFKGPITRILRQIFPDNIYSFLKKYYNNTVKSNEKDEKTFQPQETSSDFSLDNLWYKKLVTT